MPGSYLVWPRLFCPRASAGWRGIVCELYGRGCRRLACVLPGTLKESVVADAYAHARTKRRRCALAPCDLDADEPDACELLLAYKPLTEA